MLLVRFFRGVPAFALAETTFPIPRRRVGLWLPGWFTMLVLLPTPFSAADTYTFATALFPPVAVRAGEFTHTTDEPTQSRAGWL